MQNRVNVELFYEAINDIGDQIGGIEQCPTPFFCW